MELRSAGIYIFLLLLSLVVFFIELIGGFKPIHNVTDYIKNPITYFVNSIGRYSYSISSSITQTANLKEENNQLRRRILELEGQIDSQNIAKNELEKINAQQKFITQQQIKKVMPASIIDGQHGRINGMIVIDKGQQNGVRAGQYIIFNDHLVGKVSKVNEYTSLVQTIYAEGFTSKSTILSKKINALLNTKYDGIFLDDVLINEDIKKNDVVYLWDDLLPYKFKVGTIQDITTPLGSPTKRAKIDPYVKLENLLTVFILIE